MVIGSSDISRRGKGSQAVFPVEFLTVPVKRVVARNNYYTDLSVMVAIVLSAVKERPLETFCK